MLFPVALIRGAAGLHIRRYGACSENSKENQK
jgi:hypothetical protein